MTYAHLVDWLATKGQPGTYLAHRVLHLGPWLESMRDGSTLTTRGLETTGLAHGFALAELRSWVVPADVVDMCLGCLHALDVILPSHADPSPRAIFVTRWEVREAARRPEPGNGWPRNKHWVWGRGSCYLEAMGCPGSR